MHDVPQNDVPQNDVPHEAKISPAVLRVRRASKNEMEPLELNEARRLSRAKVRAARLLHPPTWTTHGSTLCARSQASPISPTAAAAIEEEYLSSCLGELELPPALLSVPPEERPAVGPCLHGCRAPVNCLQSQLAEMFSAKVRPHHISPKLEYSALL